MITDGPEASRVAFVADDFHGLKPRVRVEPDQMVRYVDLFSRLAAEHDNFEWHLTLSDPEPDDHCDGDTGFIHQVLYTSHLKDHPAPEDVEFYLCGPPVMIAACRMMIDDLGVDPSNVRYDDFGI